VETDQKATRRSDWSVMKQARWWTTLCYISSPRLQHTPRVADIRPHPLPAGAHTPSGLSSTYWSMPGRYGGQQDAQISPAYRPGPRAGRRLSRPLWHRPRPSRTAPPAPLCHRTSCCFSHAPPFTLPARMRATPPDPIAVVSGRTASAMTYISKGWSPLACRIIQTAESQPGQLQVTRFNRIDQ
jgi:hypothetical protein